MWPFSIKQYTGNLYRDFYDLGSTPLLCLGEPEKRKVTGNIKKLYVLCLDPVTLKRKYISINDLCEI